MVAGSLPGPHKGAFNRMLIGQAKLEKLSVVVIDPLLKDDAVRVCW
jgi:PIN domain nuclease of toxin-antitoxin system